MCTGVSALAAVHVAPHATMAMAMTRYLVQTVADHGTFRTARPAAHPGFSAGRQVLRCPRGELVDVQEV